MKVRHWFCLLALCVSGLAFASASPMSMLQGTSDQMLNALRSNKATLKSNPGVVYRIVNGILVPHVDLEGMSRSVLGRNIWLNANASERATFTREFTRLLIRTYSSALAAYTNETIRFMPVRGGVGGNRAQVESVIIRQNGPSIPVSYRLIYNGGSWKIYDFSVEGVSILESFRNQFANDLSSDNLGGLINKMSQHNTSRE